MANKKNNFNSLNLPSIDKAPKFVPASKVQLTQGQANELLGNKPQLRGEVPDATVSNSSNISSNDVASQLTPMQRYKIAEIIGLPKDYQPTPYQHDPATLARAQQFMQALSSYQPSQQQMMNDYNRSMTNKYLAGALGATPIEQKTPLDIQKEYINNLYDVYTKQHDMEKASNEQAQLDSISKALGIPVDSMEHLYKNIINPDLTAFSQFSNQQLKGQQASNLQTQKDTSVTPTDEVMIDYYKTLSDKNRNEINNPKPNVTIPQIIQMRKEFEGTPEVKNFKELQRQTMNVNSVYSDYISSGRKNPNMADQAIVMSVNKMLDPISVVRESEFARTAQGQSALNTLSGYMQKLAKGGSGLTEKERSDAVKLVNTLYNASVPQINNTVNYYKEMAQRAGADPRDVVPTNLQGLKGSKLIGSGSSNQKVMTDKNGNKALVEVDNNGKPIKVIREIN